MLGFRVECAYINIGVRTYNSLGIGFSVVSFTT